VTNTDAESRPITDADDTLASRNGGDVISSDSYRAGTPGDAATPTRYSYHRVGMIAVAAGQWFNLNRTLRGDL